MFRYLPLVVKSCLRNRRRTVLTVASVAASLCLLGVLMAMYNALFLGGGDRTPAQALRLVTRNRVSLAFPMPISYRQKIEAVPGVREVAVSQWFGGVYKEPQNFFARFATEPERLFRIKSEYALPDEQKRAFQQDRTGALIGRGLADKYGLRIGDRMTLVGDIFPVTLEFTVRAVYDDVFDNEVMHFHLDYLFESLPAGSRDFAGTFTILADSADDVPQIAREVDGLFRNAPIQTKTESERAFQLSFVSFLGNVKLFLASICAAITFTILLVTGNTMAMSVRERVREVGVLKTLGFPNRAILGMILGEAVVIALLGGAIGTALAAGLCGIVRRMPVPLDDLKGLELDAPLVAVCLGVAVLIGAVSSFVPAYGASRTPILDALKRTV